MFVPYKSHLLMSLVLLTAHPAIAEIYTCDENGKTVYRDRPCNGAAIEAALQEQDNETTIPEFKITAEEERAFIKGAQGMMERLEDPQWLKLMQENQPGCWRTKEELVPEGQSISFENVVSRCVKLGKGFEATYMFIPSRIIHYCQDTNIQLEICLDNLDGHSSIKSPSEKEQVQPPQEKNIETATPARASHQWVIEKVDLLGRWTDVHEDDNPLRSYWTFSEKTLTVKKSLGYTIKATYTLQANKLIIHHKASEFRKKSWDEEIELISHEGNVLTWKSSSTIKLYKLN